MLVVPVHWVQNTTSPSFKLPNGLNKFELNKLIEKGANAVLPSSVHVYACQTYSPTYADFEQATVAAATKFSECFFQTASLLKLMKAAQRQIESENTYKIQSYILI